MIQRSISRFILGACMMLPAAANAEVFSIAVITDSQFYAENHPEILEAQIDWIVANQAEENIIYVVQTGDLKDNQFCDDNLVDVGSAQGRGLTEWQIVDDAFEDLDDANLPYGVLPGNHDFNPVSDGMGGIRCPSGSGARPLGLYNTYFGKARFTGKAFYGGHLDPNNTTNSNEDNYTLFESNGTKFISINLAFRQAPNPTPPNLSVNLLRDNPELNWANTLLQDHDDRLAIVTSHYFLNTQGDTPPMGQYGQAVYDALSGNRNLFMMLSGHWWGEAWISQTTGRPTGAGPVQALMANYQGHEFPDDTDPATPAGTPTPNPAFIDFSNLPARRAGLGTLDAGFMRIMRFDTDTRMVAIETFIPPVVPIKNRTGTIVSTYTATSGADMNEKTASNLSFSFDGYVDTTPDPFSFADQTGVAPNTAITSNAITVSGIDAAANISVSGGQYSIDSGAFTSAAGTVNNGQSVRVRVTSSSSDSTTTGATLTIGGVGDTFSVTTAASIAPVVQLVQRPADGINLPLPPGTQIPGAATTFPDNLDKLKVTCLARIEDPPLSSTTCPIVVFNGITYWAFSYVDNRGAMNIVGYDQAGNIVQQTNKNGVRYIFNITVDTTNRVVTFTGQAGNTATMTYSSNSQLLIP